MINTLEAAKEAAHKYLNEDFSKAYDDELIVMEPTTKDYGWIFAYQSKKYLETGIFSYWVPNGPMIVLKDGTIEMLGTALPPEEAIAKYEQSRNKE